MNAATLTLRLSHLDTLYRLGRMSQFEAWLWGLCDEPTGKRDARPKHAPLNNVALAGPVAVRAVDALGHVRGVAGVDQGLGVCPVHDDQRQAKTLQPEAEEAGNPPRDPAPIAAVGGLEFCNVAVGEAQPVVEFLLGDAESLPTAPQQGDELLFIPNGDRLHAHVEPHNQETPHG